MLRSLAKASHGIAFRCLVCFIPCHIEYSQSEYRKVVVSTWVIDQLRGPDGWILAKIFFLVDRDGLEVHKLGEIFLAGHGG